MKFTIGDKIIFFRVNTSIVDINKIQLGINSGRPFIGSHFTFLDYDDGYPDEFKDIIINESFRRGLIVESSPSKYHALSFSPRPYDIVLGITSNAKGCHSAHKAATINNGFATLRFTPKKNFKIRVVEEINNLKGTNFYSYDHERVYLERLINWEVKK